MNTLLIFFAFPIAVIIVSAILEKVLNNPIAVASLIFAIFLVITFAFFDETFLIATIVYTILAFLTAAIVRFICESNNSDSDDDSNCNCGCTNTVSTSDETVGRTLNSNNRTVYGYTYNRYRR